MKRAWTADLHLGHGSVLSYASRPFRDVQHMHEALVRGFNERLKPEDTCVHVGDLGMGSKRVIYETLARFDGRWTLVSGNHDRSNGIKTIGNWLFTSIGKYRVFVSHAPYFYRREEGSVTHILSDDMIRLVEAECDFSLCGHVHNAWSHSLEGGIPTINVGVDVCNYRPMFDDEVIVEYERIRLCQKKQRRKNTTNS